MPTPRRKLRLTPALLGYVCLALLGLYALAGRMAPYHGLTEAGCRVGFVYDGDTVELLCGAGTERARLVGFDTPETTEPGCAAEGDLGLQAKLRLGDLVARAQGQPEGILLDATGIDRYGRRLVTMRIFGRDVADIMIEEGLAVAYGGAARTDWCARLGG